MENHDLLLSGWITETARSAVLSGRGHGDAGSRAAKRARLLASHLARRGIKIQPRMASEHAEWLNKVAGTEEETGALGWFFLQRVGMFVEAHAAEFLDERAQAEMAALAADDLEAVNAAVAEHGLPPAPPPEWPTAPRAMPPGEVTARIGILGDPHIGTAMAEKIAPIAIGDLNQLGVDMTVIIGDITQDGREHLFVRAKEVFSGFQAPYIATLGNHDMWGRGDEPAGLQRFKSTFETQPYGEIEANGVRAVAVNSALAVKSMFPPFDLTMGMFTDQPNESIPGGGFTDDVRGFLESLEPGPPTFMFLHHPPYPYLGFPPLVFGLDASSTTVLMETAKRIRALGIFVGHTHRCAHRVMEDIDIFEVPSSKEWPFGIGLIEVSEEGWSYNLEPLSDKELVAEASATAGLLFRRYARGAQTSRAFSKTSKLG